MRVAGGLICTRDIGGMYRMISRTLIRKQPGRRWLTALATLSLATSTLVIASTASAFVTTNFGLDRDATTTQDASLAHIGGLKGSINSTVTSFIVCELAGSPPANGSTIQIDAERMTIVSTATTTAGTGGCSFANPNDVPLRTRSWTVARHAAGTTAAAHVGTAPRNNITLVTAGTLHDWDQVYADHVADNDCATSGAAACVWKNRPNSGTATSANDFTGPTTFTQTSGDLQTVAQWRWTNQSVPDADEINDAFAAKYQSVSDQQLMFGMDRFAVNGTKDIGFWFFHQDVGPVDGGTFSGAHCYGGQTTDGCDAPAHGDILILTSFSAGGGTTTVRAFEWVGNGPGSATSSDGVLDQVAVFGDCVPAGAGNGCATTANSTVPAPWAHTEKPTGASANVFYASGFMEGGIDLTAAGLEGCFASFLGVSRSSTTLTAQPKAFVLGHLESCSSGIETKPADGDGTLLTDSGDADTLPEIQIGTGAAGVDVTDSTTITVGGQNTWDATLHTYICGPIASGTCDTGGLEIGTGTAIDETTTQPIVSGSANLTSVGRYCWRGFVDFSTAGLDDQTDSSEGECFEVLPVTPTLSTSAGPDVVLGNPITDTADLAGTAYQPGTDGPNATYPSINATMDTAAGGTITFTLVGPNNCTDVPAGFTPIDVDVSGDSSTAYTASFTPGAIGEYTWIAEYSGDDPNTLGAGPTACPDANEAVVVTGTAGLSTAQDWLPNDTATITGPTALSGTATFTLYTGSDCNAGDDDTVVYGPVDVPVSGASPQTAATSNSTLILEAGSGPYSWLVTYDDANLTSPDPTCETTTITIDDTP